MLKVGFIGTGGISGVHLRYLKKRKDVDIVALCDINPENLQRRQHEFGGAGFADFHAMLDAVDLDAVWLCTPPQVRREPLLACAERGLPVFCEKPVERDLRKAETIAAELEDRSAHVQVGYVFRTMPIVQRLREAMADDSIHLVQSLYACGVSLSRGLASWFYDKARSGGALVDQATHNLDLLRSLMGEVRIVTGLAANPVEAKHDGYTIDEVLSVSFAFENGAVGGHVHTWVGDAWRNEILLCGEKRLYRINLGAGILTIEQGDETTTVRQNQGLMYEHENRVFLDMVTSDDWSGNPSDYADGVKSLKLTLDCDAALEGASVS